MIILIAMIAQLASGGDVTYQEAIRANEENVLLNYVWTIIIPAIGTLIKFLWDFAMKQKKGWDECREEQVEDLKERIKQYGEKNN